MWLRSTSRGPASSISTSTRRGPTTCCAKWSPPATGTAVPTRSRGQRVNLEFVSANPTGPLHAGGGRWVAVGDAIANLLAAQGAEVHREYYLNDAGHAARHVRRVAARARCDGEEPPGGGLPRATTSSRWPQRMRAELGDDITLEAAREWGYSEAVRELRDDLGRIGVHFDTWFSERALHERDDVDDVLRMLDEAGHTFEQDGATWLRTTDVRRRARPRRSCGATARPRIWRSDLAYHRDKMRRGFTHLIDIWGADHHGQVKSLQAGMQALGFGPPPEPEVLLGQLVKLVRGGEEVRLSKRAGNIITLADILDDVDPDVVRMTFLLLSIDSPQTFDLDVVTAQSMENPVYYVQYAHARVASIERKAAEAGVVRRPLDTVDLGRLEHEREHELLRDARRRIPTSSPTRPSCARRRRSRPGCASSRRGSTASTASAACSPTTPSSPRPGSGSSRRAASVWARRSGCSA